VNTVFGFERKAFAIAVILIAVRLWLGLKTGIWYQVFTPVDDSLLINYAPLSLHFADIGGAYSLAKTISFPVFLNIVHYSGLPYTFVLSAVWIICGCLAVRLVRRLRSAEGASPIFELIVLAFVLFNPAFFDITVGTRLYRNSIIAPFALLLFLLLFLFALRVAGRKGLTARHWVFAVVIGALLTFNYYITEAGMWLLPIILLALFFAAAIALWKGLRKEVGEGSEVRDAVRFTRSAVIRTIVICCIPLLVFGGMTQIYKGINFHYFGVYETDTRTSGEPGKFVANIYKIYSQDRTAELWAPPDAIEQAFAASPTLQSHPELEDAIMNHALWSGDLRKNPQPGDHFTWVLIDALVTSGMWQNQAETSAFFKTVNSELDAAFKDGTLQKDPRVQLFSSAGGRTPQEITGLAPLVWQGLKSAIMYDGYEYSGDTGAMSYSADEGPINPMRVQAEFFLNMKLDNGQETNWDGSPLVFGARESKGIDLVINTIFKVYRYVGIPLFVIGFAGFVVCIARLFQKKRRTSWVVMRFVLMAGSLLTAAIVSFGTAWFSEFLITDADRAVLKMHYYAVGATPCIVLFIIIGALVLFETFHTRVSPVSVRQASLRPRKARPTG